MATLLAFGLTYGELIAMDDTFLDLWHYLLTLQAPAFPGPIDEALAREGRPLFDRHCASCHGVHSGSDASFPDRVVARAQVGTDPERAASFTDAEATFVNGTWFAADHPMEATGGYLAPPLVGVWATAPYFHNGSVPTVRALLEPSARPTRWRREPGAFDPEAVGLVFEVVDDPASDPDPVIARKVYDTTLPGLSNAGHTFGEALTAGEREAVLAYLKSL
jgi:mono/diheme cytochrome c family protein